MRSGSRATIEVLRGWGGVHQGRSHVYRVTSAESAAEALGDAQSRGLTVAHRGAGQSYGDLVVNEGGAVLDLSGLAGVLSLDPSTGLARVRAGTTIEQLWGASLPLGWWPLVVPGTMKVTVGGAVASNIHGKNHVAAGSFGEHVRALTLLDPDGSVRALAADRAEDRAALAATIGGLGLTGTILDVTLQLHRVHSGLLDVEARATATLGETLDVLEAGAAESPYAVAWVDPFPSGARAGRGVLHFARYVPQGHARAGAAMTAAEQALPGRILGIVPRSYAWLGLRAFFSDPGLRALNAARHLGGRAKHGHRSFEPHARFHFLLDYVPGWKRAYGGEGLVQYQLFVPRAAAREALSAALRLQEKTGAYSYLAVAKRHRADALGSPSTYLVDGFSLALDFPVRPYRLDALVRLFRSYDALLREVGGRVYAAKDGVSAGRLPAARHPLFSSNLVRRWQAGEAI